MLKNVACNTFYTYYPTWFQNLENCQLINTCQESLETCVAFELFVSWRGKIVVIENCLE